MQAPNNRQGLLDKLRGGGALSSWSPQSKRQRKMSFFQIQVSTGELERGYTVKSREIILQGNKISLLSSFNLQLPI
jgi:hypothetical protein